MPAAKVTVEPARCQRFVIGQISSRWMRLHFANGRELYFYNGSPIALFDGSYLWHHHDPSPAITRTLNLIEPQNAPRINCSAAEFDFAVGQALTMTGLPLTRLQEGGK